MKEIVVLLLIIATNGGTKSFSVELSEYYKNGVIIEDFHWPANATSVGTIPDVELLHFENIVVNILPRNFTDHFQKCIKIECFNGKVKTIHISPKLTLIKLMNTRTENVIIERGIYYQLGDFRCCFASLTRLPENMSQLKKLTHLDLSYNSIQTVQLDQLNGLDNLKTLFLQENQIIHINNHGSVSLPSLTHLLLDRNQLKYIDVCGWNLRSLSNLDLGYNKLTHFAINHFRRLNEVNLAGNPLNCVWQNSLVRDRTDIKEKIVFSCDTNSKGAFGLDCPSTIDQLRLQNSFRFTQIEETLLNNYVQFSKRVQILVAIINRRFEQIEELLEKHNSTIVEQHNVSNNIIEAFYRAEIESTYNTNRRFEKIEELQEKLSSKIVEQQNISKDIIETIYRAEIEKTYSTEKTP